MRDPNRWLHLQHEDGFSDERYAQFVAHCRTWTAYVQSVLDDWERLLPSDGSAPHYEFFEPEISDDRRTVTLPIGGAQTLASRAIFENNCSRLLWEYFPVDFLLGLQEGLTETTDSAQGPATNWRPVLSPEQDA